MQEATREKRKKILQKGGCQPLLNTRYEEILHARETAVVQVFVRLKRDRDGRLVNQRTRGLDKITLNCLLSVWVVQARVAVKANRMTTLF